MSKRNRRQRLAMWLKPATALLAALCAWAQEPRLEVESRLVLVPATVVDAKGQPVEDLEPAEFVLLDNGKRQPVTVDTIATGVAPIALVIAVQDSGISTAALAKVRKIGGMIQPLVTGERGRAALLAFGDEIEWRQDFTNDSYLLERAFQELRPRTAKRGRMLDALHEAVERLKQRSNVRRVVLLVSESRDRGSETDVKTALVEAQTAGVAVYAISYSAIATAFTAKPSDAGPAPQPKRVPLANQTQKDVKLPGSHSNIPVPAEEQRVDLAAALGELARSGRAKTVELLARGTGGSEFSFTRQKGLEEAVQRLGEELHSQYVLSFVPPAPAPGYHRLEVGVARRGEFRVRARPGYWRAQ